MGRATPTSNRPMQWRKATLDQFVHKHRPRDQTLLEAELTTENYKEKFHQLLCREEEEHERILQERYNILCFPIAMVTVMARCSLCR